MRILWTLAVVLFAGCGGGRDVTPPSPAAGLWAHAVDPPAVPGADDRSKCVEKSDLDYQWRVCPTGAIRRNIHLRSVWWKYSITGELQTPVLVDRGRAAWVPFDRSWMYLVAGAEPFVTPDIQGAPSFSGSKAYWLDDKSLRIIDASSGAKESWSLPEGLPKLVRIRHATPTYIVLEVDPARAALRLTPDLWLLEYDRKGAPALALRRNLSELIPASMVRAASSRHDFDNETPARVVRSFEPGSATIYYLDRSGLLDLRCDPRHFSKGRLSSVERRAETLYLTIGPPGFDLDDRPDDILVIRGDKCRHIATATRRVINDDGSLWYLGQSGLHHVDRELREREVHGPGVKSFVTAGLTVAWFLTVEGQLHRAELGRDGKLAIGGPWTIPEIEQSPDRLRKVDLVEDSSGTSVWIASGSTVARATLEGPGLAWRSTRVSLEDRCRAAADIASRWSRDLVNLDYASLGGLGDLAARDLRGLSQRLVDWDQAIEDLPKGVLVVGTGALAFRDAGTVLKESELSEPVFILLPLAEQPGQPRQVNIEIRDGNDTVLADHWFRTSSPSPIVWKTGSPSTHAGSPLRVRLDIHPLFDKDPFRGLRAEWTGVVIQPMLPPWYARPWSKAVFLALALLVVILALSVVAPKIPTLGQWLGLIVLGGGGALAWRGVDGDISVPVFAGVLGGSLLVFGALGALHASILDTLGQIQPTRVVAQVVCRFPAVRRRMYAEPAARVQRWLEGRVDPESGAKLASTYVSLPAAMECVGVTSADEEPEPARWIVEQLERPLRHRPHVLVLGPAGCGKTVLLRSVTSALLERHRASARNPLPVVLELQQSKVPIRESLWKELERSVRSRDVFDWAVAAGDYIVIIDGITERDLSSADYQDFFRSRDSAGLRMFASARPSDEALEAFRAESQSAIVRPRPLDDTHHKNFVEQLGLPGGLPEATLRVCRQADGTYLPLLVRLAILAHAAAGNEDVDIVGLFRRGVDRLLFGNRDEDDALRLAAMKLAYDSYWIAGRRSFLLTEAFVPPTEVRDRLRESLLVSVGQREHEFRFAHDSIQVYLAAEQLVRDDNRAAFYEAATAPRFRPTTAAAGGPELPEMFHFSCLAFDSAVVRRQLLGELRGWAATHSDLLARAQIRAAMPEPLGAHVDGGTPPDQSAGKVLELAADWLESAGDEDLLSLFYVRIARNVAEGQVRWRAA